MILYILIPLPYLTVFFISLIALMLFGMKTRPAFAASALFSLALNLSLMFVSGLNSADYSMAALGFALRLLPYIIAAGVIAMLFNLKAIFTDIDSPKPRRVVFSVMLAAAVVGSGVLFYSYHPRVIVSESDEKYIDRDTLRKQLRPHDPGLITLYIEVKGADSDGYTAEAVYFPWGGSLGVSEYKSADGRVAGEYYDPER